MRLPDQLARAIEQQTSTFEAKALARAAEELSQRYRLDSRAPKERLKSPVERAAYLVTRLPATYAAVCAVFEEIKQRVHDEIRSLLDLGAGPGTAAWAATEAFSELEQITLVERDAEFVSLGKALAQHSHSAALRDARWVQAELGSQAELSPHDLVVFSYSLGEISSPHALLDKNWKAARLALAVVEPGTPLGFGTVLKARDRLIAAGAHLAAPCPHELQCPMAAAGNDWCHFAVRLERSRLHRQAKSASVGYEDEKFSYVVAARSEVQRARARIIRHPVQHKGHIRLELCAPQGLKSVVVTRSDREAFRQARRAAWGDEWNSESLGSSSGDVRTKEQK